MTASTNSIIESFGCRTQLLRRIFGNYVFKECLTALSEEFRR